MEPQALWDLKAQDDPAAQARAMRLFEQMKASENGWELCMTTLTSDTQCDAHVSFFCFQVIQHYIKTRYAQADEYQQQTVRNFFSRWIQIQSNSVTFVKNKAAQIFSLVFLVDYNSRWPSFFSDILGTLSQGAGAVDCYLRLLKAIDSEIVDREIVHTRQELERNTLIKDTMREECLNDLVESWYHIVNTYGATEPELVCICLEVIGSYISWIDISLIANDKFVAVLVNFMSNPVLRESACDCVHEIICKGMEPVAKTKLIESFVSVFDQAKVLDVDNECDPDFKAKLAKLVNGMGTSLIMSWNKLRKLGDEMYLPITQQAIHSKVSLMLKFLGDEDDDVSSAIIEFVREYIQLLKTLRMCPNFSQNVESILFILFKKFKYDESYSFEHQGEDEAMFDEYRKQLKVLFDNLAQLDKDIVLDRTKDLIIRTLKSINTCDFRDIEAAITLLYLLGEAIPVTNGNHFSGEASRVSAMQEMIRILVTSEASCYSHMIVNLQFFETIVRYEKFFLYEPEHLPDVIIAFLDNRGLRNPSLKVRSRTAYLISRFIKCLKSQLYPFTEDILKRLQQLMVLSPAENGSTEPLLSSDDQLFLYEAAAILIVSSQYEVPRKQLLMKNLLMPVMTKFNSVLEALLVEKDQDRQVILSECLNHAMAVTSRTSKAFSNQQTMKSCGCVQPYLDILHVFLRSLQVPYEQQLLQSGVRQFLHRMVVCLEDEILPYIPIASEHLLKNSDIKSIQEFIPLINQIITKFKKDIVPFLQKVFMPIITTIFNALSIPVEENDELATRDRQTLQRSYFIFIASIVTNNVTDVLASQDMSSMHRVLLTVIQGAVDFPDPVAQKTCFTILKKLVDMWAGEGGMAGFDDFMYKSIVPACFIAPLKTSFDLSDAQTILVLSEIASCMKTIYAKKGQELLNYLQTQYFPTTDVSPELVTSYCDALKSDPKIFKKYINMFFQKAKS